MNHRIHSQKRFRIQAMLVAFLYVFLCTVGALTHSHATPDGALDSMTVASQGHTSAPTTLHGGSENANHCAYCDWQADSVSPALTPQFCIGIETHRVIQPTLTLSRSRVFASRASSRAPPSA
ncbi:MAG: hypothetical protein NT023_01575 [Armatimonadetes bacterium]|nr:hypothetical protein [Armatimonadota bacterium]